MSNPMQPSPALLCKLGSIAVHAEELASPDGHPFDRVALTALLQDPQVRQWIEQMNAMAMVPRMRKERG